jgi:hypothetical protein
MAGFIVVAETAFILLAVLMDMSRFSAFVTGDARVFRREVGGGNESGSKLGELFVPSHAIYGRGWWMNKDFNARGRGC